MTANGLCAVEVLLVVCCRGAGEGAAHVFKENVGEGDVESCGVTKMRLTGVYLREEGYVDCG